MKVLLYAEFKKQIERSGVGRALLHQQKALESAGIPFTMNPADEYDIAHINTIFPGSLMLSRRVGAMGKKVVYHAHSTEEDFRNSFRGSNLTAPLFRRWISRCYNSGDLILTPTPYAKSLLEAYGLKKEIVPVSNGIDLSAFRRDAEKRRRFRRRYGLSDTEKVIISAGLYIKRKGILDFVALARRMPEYRFFWFGHTDLRVVPSEVRRAVKTGLPNLFFPGYIPREQMMEAYCGGDLFLFLTHEETEGIVLLEALAMQIPVLIRDIPIYRDWLEDGRDLYKAATLPGFERRIRGILDGCLADLTEAGYEIARERDICRVGRTLQTVYAQLLVGEAPSRPQLRPLSPDS